MESVYKYKVAMYLFGNCAAYFELKENLKGDLVPVDLIQIYCEKIHSWWHMGHAFGLIDFRERRCVTRNLQEVNVYEEIIKESPKNKEMIGSESEFWKNVICLQFYRKENYEYTITAMIKSKWRRYKFKGFIKSIHIPNNYSDEEIKAVVFELISAAKNCSENPKKTPVNVEEFRKDESIGKHRFPWLISVYKGEGRILIIPYLDHVGGYGGQANRMVILDDTANEIEIGAGIMETIEIIKTSPRLVGPIEGYKLATKYKSWSTFIRKNKSVSVRINEDYSYKIYPEKGYSSGEHKVVGAVRDLPSNVSVEEIGKVILDSFTAIDKFNKENKDDTQYPTKTVELMDESKLTVKHPRDRHFKDCEDCGVGEIYQCYSYYPQEDSESSADFFLGIAPEIDCNLEPENIRSSWEEVYGKSEYFEVHEADMEIFTLRSEIRTKKVHKISYLLQMEEDLILECSMDVHQPNRRKKLDEKLSQMFEEFALNCKKSNE